MASRAKRGIGGAWAWCVEKVKRGCSLLCAFGKVSLSLSHLAACVAWKYRKTTLVALTAGLLVGVGAYFCGPLVASSLCGVGGTVTTGAGMALWSVWKAISGKS